MRFAVSTSGFGEVLDITGQVCRLVTQSGVFDGVVPGFVAGSTAALSTIEFEPGAIRDLQEDLERIAPANTDYRHNEAWGDGNGYAHLRAALMKPSLSIPMGKGSLLAWNLAASHAAGPRQPTPLQDCSREGDRVCMSGGSCG